MSKLERRTIPVELRASEGTSAAPTISGYAIVFDSLSCDLGGFQERIATDAVIEYDDVVAKFNHDSNFVLGRASSGTLKLTRDEKGLQMEVVPPATSWAADLLVSMRRGDISQQSFAFRVMPDGQQWGESLDGGLVRTLTNIKISDVSVVTEPAYADTDAHVRSMCEILSDRPAAAGEAASPAIADGALTRNLRLHLDLSEREV